MSMLAETEVSDTLEFKLADDKRKEMTPTSSSSGSSGSSGSGSSGSGSSSSSSGSSGSSGSGSKEKNPGFVVDDTGDPFAIIAPTIEEVDANPEELRTLRGEGRYFGVVDPSDAAGSGTAASRKKCRKCNQPGHLAKSCKTVLCMLCGMVNDHYTEACTKSIKCSNCNEVGHYRSQCPKKWKKTYCQICNSSRHVTERCPDVWRSYKLKTASAGDEQGSRGKSKKKENHVSVVKPVLRWDLIWCYNCAKKGHFGDDCQEQRSSRVPLDDGSAFSGYNLEVGLQGRYFDNLKEQQEDSYYSSSRYSSESSYNTNSSTSRFSNNKSDLIQYRSNQNKQKQQYSTSYSGNSNSGGSSSSSRNPQNFYKPPYNNNRNQNNYGNNSNNNSNYNSNNYNSYNNNGYQKTRYSSGNNNSNSSNSNPLSFPRGGSMYDYDDSSKYSKSINTSRYKSASASNSSNNNKNYNSNKRGNFYDELVRKDSSGRSSNKVSKKPHKRK